MVTNQRIRRLMKAHALTEYRLVLDSGLPKSTVSALLHRNTPPSVPTIEAVCDALGITVGPFFAEDGDNLPVNEEQRLLLQRYAQLTETQKTIIRQTMLEFLHESAYRSWRCFACAGGARLSYDCASPLYDLIAGK